MHPLIRFFCPWFCFLIFVGLFQSAQLSLAQKCPSTKVNERQLETVLQRIGLENNDYFENNTENAGMADEIYRLAAIGGTQLIPALRRLSKPHMPMDSVPGAAEVSLAKLGDAKAFQQILHDLKGASHETQRSALAKLGRTGNEQAASILIRYYLSHISMASNGRMPISTEDEGITSSDWLLVGLRVLEPFMINPPSPFNFQSQVWTQWCRKNKDSSVTWHLRVSDSLSLRQSCLVRKINWGFSDAILDLAVNNDRRPMAILKELTRVGNRETRTSAFDTTRGKAQVALAMLGDSDEFDAIANELDTSQYPYAITKLEFIGGKKAAQVLVHGLESNSAFSGQSWPEWRLSEEKKKRNDLIIAALNKIVLIPRKSADKPEGRGEWIVWWEKKNNIVRFASAPAKSYE